jgi:hypothetical protein
MMPQAPNLEMIRLVFEDFSCLEIREISGSMTDRTLEAIAFGCPKLDILAVTRCPEMTPQGFGMILSKCAVRVFDLHKSPEGDLGQIDDAFFEALGPKLCQPVTISGPSRNVSVVNIFGQQDLSEDVLIKAIDYGWLSKLKSLSLNFVKITERFLLHVAEHLPGLETLSIKHCDQIAQKTILSFLIHLKYARLWEDKALLPKLKRLYALEERFDEDGKEYFPLSKIHVRDDMWFADECLDIQSLWEKATKELTDAV